MAKDPAGTDDPTREPVRLSGPDGVALLRQFPSLGGLAVAVEEGDVTISVAAGYTPPDPPIGAEVLQFPNVVVRPILDGLGKIMVRLEEMSVADTAIAADCGMIARELLGLRQDMAEIFGAVRSRQEDWQAALAQVAADNITLAETRVRVENLEERNRSTTGSKHPDSA